VELTELTSSGGAAESMVAIDGCFQRVRVTVKKIADGGSQHARVVEKEIVEGWSQRTRIAVKRIVDGRSAYLYRRETRRRWTRYWTALWTRRDGSEVFEMRVFIGAEGARSTRLRHRIRSYRS
jgi:hypothetical protein